MEVILASVGTILLICALIINIVRILGFVRSARRQNSDIEALSDWINTASDRRIESWVRRVLYKDPEYMPYELPGPEPAEILLRIFQYRNDAEIQFKLCMALDALACKTFWDKESTEYLATLLSAIGYLNVQSVCDLLIRRGNEGILKERRLKSGESVHRFLLAALGPMVKDERAVYLLSRDLLEPEFSDICFRALWKYNLFLGITNASSIMRVGLVNDQFPMRELLTELVSALSLEQAWNLSMRIFSDASLGDTHKKVFASYLRQGELGIRLESQDDESLLLVRSQTSEYPLHIRIEELSAEIKIYLWLVWYLQDQVIQSRRGLTWQDIIENLPLQVHGYNEVGQFSNN